MTDCPDMTPDEIALAQSESPCIDRSPEWCDDYEWYCSQSDGLESEIRGM